MRATAEFVDGPNGQRHAERRTARSASSIPARGMSNMPIKVRDFSKPLHPAVVDRLGARAGS
jgi:hypothetical protein